MTSREHRRGTSHGLYALLAVAACALAASTSAAQPICTVPGTHATITAALDSPSCSIIDLASPAYHEALTINRSVQLRGRGAQRTTLYGVGPDGVPFGVSAVTVRLGAVVVLSDLAVRDGKAPNGGGITNDGGQLTLLRCLIENNEATDIIGEGGGILNRAGGGLSLIETTVRKNKARLNGGGISSSGLSVPILSDPAARDSLAEAYTKLRSIRIPAFNPFPTPATLVAIGEAFIGVSEAVVDAVGNLVTKGFSVFVDDAAPASRTSTSFLASGFTALAIADSVIEANTVDAAAASAWGGGIHVDQGIVIIENTRITHNEVKARIGAFGAGVSAGLSFVIIRNSQVVHNTAKSQTVASGGGALWNLAGAMEVHDSRLDDNAATSFFLNHGGGLHNLGGIARVFRSTIERNKSGNGGGISNNYMGQLTVEDSSIRDNVIDGIISAFGGGILNEKGGTVTIRRSAIVGNTINGRSRGGGIYNESEAEIRQISVGGINQPILLWDTSRVTVENSTISGNIIDGAKQVPVPFDVADCLKELEFNLAVFPASWQAAYERFEECKETGFGETTVLHLPARGAAIYTGSQKLGRAYTTLRNTTVAFNESRGQQASGGGVYASLSSGLNVLQPGLITEVSVESSLVTHNQPTDCEQFLYDSPLNFSATRANLDSDGTCRAMDSDFSTANPQLLPLARYGGPTVTHALGQGSPALNSTNGCPSTDQRGEDRSLGGICDIGAFELTPPRGLPDSYAGEEDVPLVVTGEAGVLANDMGLGLGEAQVVTPPQHGQIALSPNGTFTYTPDPDFFGADGFAYRATDLSGVQIGPIQVSLAIAGRLDVLDVTPAPEALGVPRTPVITVTFDDPMAVSGVSGRVFLYGDRSRLQPRSAVPVANLSASGNTLTVVSPTTFAIGERVTLVLSDLVTSVSGSRLAKPVVIEMVVATDGGGGGFVPMPFGNMIGHKVVLGDLDGDGDLDAIIASEFTDVHTRVWINQNGAFIPGQELTFLHRTRSTQPFRASDLALADLDDDGDLDLIATTRQIDQFILGERDGIHTRVWFNQGNGTFVSSNQEFLSGTYPDPSSPVLAGPSGALWRNTAAHRGVALGDLDGDGDVDAFIVAGAGLRGSIGSGAGEGARWDSVWMNDGQGRFSRTATLGTEFAEAVVLGDADGDGDLDAFVANVPGPSKLWINDGRGQFSPGRQFPSASDVQVGDLDGDGNLDVIFDNTSTTSLVWLGDGSGGFIAAPNQPQALGFTGVAVGDIDGDGDLDLFMSNGLHFEFFAPRGIRDQVWLNDGNANFSLSRQAFPLSVSSAVAFGDIDRDGILDAVVLHFGSETITTSTGEFTRAARAPAEVWFGLPLPQTAPDTYSMNEDGILTRNASGGVLANDAAPGAIAVHESRLDTYTTSTGTLGRLWIELDALGINLNDVEFDHAEDVGWFATHRVIIGLPEHGTVTLAPNGGFEYVPNPDFFGTDQFTYFAQTPAAESAPPETVTIHVSPVNDPPVARDDFYAFHPAGISIAAANGVLSNDEDVDGDPITATLVTPALRGTVVLQTDGGFTYAPGATQTGGDVFFYRAVDPSGAQSAPARVKIGNSAPVFTGPGVYTPNPDGSLSVGSGDGLLAGATDPDGDTLIAIITVHPRHGTVVVEADGRFVYTPGPNWPGSDVFEYVVSDGIDSSLPVRVKVGNAAPQARDDRYVTGLDTALTVPAPGVLANDSDFDGDAITASLVTPPASGSVQLQADGSFHFIPASGFTGEATFTYAVSDALSSSLATVKIGVFNELRVVSTAPPAHAVNAASDTNVAIEFDLDVAAATTPGRVVVRGAQTGARAVALSTTGKFIHADPLGEFLPGERVTASALVGIESVSGARLMRTHARRFDIATAAASGQLEDAGQALGNTTGEAVAFGDVDGDGDLDAIVVGVGAASSKLWLNDGNGVFHEDTTQTLRGANDVALGDLDGDGDLDLFVAGIANGTIAVINQGGHFDWPASIPNEANLAPGGKLVKLADLDGDGSLDAVVGTNDGARSVVVLLNDGSGGFRVVSELAAGDVRSIALADLDGDGVHDLVIGNLDGVRTWRGDGNGAFPTPLTVQTNTTLFLLAATVDVGDLNGDGHVDVIAGGFLRRIFLNDGHGTLTEMLSTYPGQAQQVVLGDFNGDGHLDFIVATGRSRDDGSRPHEVWLNDGHAVFTEAPRAPTHSDRGVSVAVGDLDGDGDLDAFTGTNRGLFSPSPDRVLLNRTTTVGTPTGRFVDSTQRLGDAASLRPVLVDIDGDGDLDAYVVHDYESLVTPVPDQLWINDGTGAFTPAATGPAQVSVDAAFGDLNGDGHPDLLLVGIPSRVYLNDGHGNLVLHGPALEDTLAGRVHLADLDGDGDLDAVQLRQGANDIFTIWRNNGSGTFSLAATLTRPPKVADPTSFSTTVWGVAIFDADGDGDLDIYATTTTAEHTLWRNDGSGNFPVAAAQTYPGNFRSRVSAGDLDGDGDIDLLLSGIATTAMIRLNDGAGTFANGQTFTFQTAGQTSMLADVNADGILDAVFARTSEPAEFWINDGAATFTFQEGVIGTGLSHGLAFGDLDGDGDQDAFVAQGTPGLNRVSRPDEVWFNTTLSPILAITGTRPLVVGDDTVAAPFADVIVTAPTGNSVVLGIEADTIALGQMTGASLGAAGFTEASAGTWRYGPALPALATAALRSLRFEPIENRVPVGVEESVTLTLRASSDDDSVLDAATILTIVSINDVPLAGPPLDVTVAEGGWFELAAPGLLAGAIDPDVGDVLDVELIEPPAAGEMAIQANGALVFVAGNAPRGPLTFRYQVRDGRSASAEVVGRITVIGGNRPPFGLPESYGTSEDTALVIGAPGVLANDGDPDGDPVQAQLVAVVHGEVDLSPSGGFIYTPAENFTGDDTFVYVVFDGQLTSAPVTVTIQVLPINDAPVALPDEYATPRSVALEVPAPGVLGNDLDPDDDPLTAVLVDPPARGTLVLGSDGSVHYTPAANFEGVVTFTYRAHDGTVGSEPVTVTIAVGRAEGTVNGGIDIYFIDQNAVLEVPPAGVLHNDSDPDGGTLQATVAEEPSHGSLELRPDGSFTYTPQLDFAGTDLFLYTAGSGVKTSQPVPVIIVVEEVNQAPIAVPDTYDAVIDRELVVAAPGVLANDTDPESDTLTAELVTDPAHGSVSLRPDGSFTYTPSPGYAGPDAFTYRAFDGSRYSQPVEVSLTILRCGDMQLDDGEQCDDGNRNDDDGCTNTCRLQPEKTIAGQGAALTNCAHQWLVTPAPRRGARVRCTDGDPSCDAGPAGDGVCHVRLALCFNVDDPRGRCESRSVSELRIVDPGVKPRTPGDEENREALERVLEQLGAPTGGSCMRGPRRFQPCGADADCDSRPGRGDGRCQITATFEPALASANQCTASTLIAVPMRERGTRWMRGLQRLRVQAMTADPAERDALRRDLDTLTLICDP